MLKEINVVGFGMLPCLHCGEIVKMDGEIHMCNKKLNWLDEQKVALVKMPDGSVFDLKNKKVVTESISKRSSK